MERIGCKTNESIKLAILLASFGDKWVLSYSPVISALGTLFDDIFDLGDHDKWTTAGL